MRINILISFLDISPYNEMFLFLLLCFPSRIDLPHHMLLKATDGPHLWTLSKLENNISISYLCIARHARESAWVLPGIRQVAQLTYVHVPSASFYLVQLDLCFELSDQSCMFRESKLEALSPHFCVCLNFPLHTYYEIRIDQTLSISSFLAGKKNHVPTLSSEFLSTVLQSQTS